jgi:hypothetical protein
MLRSPRSSAVGADRRGAPTPTPEVEPLWLEGLIAQAEQAHLAAIKRLQGAIFLFRVALAGGDASDQLLDLAHEVREAHQTLKVVQAALARLLQTRAGRP